MSLRSWHSLQVELEAGLELARRIAGRVSEGEGRFTGSVLQSHSTEDLPVPTPAPVP
jgi:hypothetical protein